MRTRLRSLLTGKNTGNSMAFLWGNVANALVSMTFAHVRGKPSREFSNVYQGIESRFFRVLVERTFHPPQQASP